MENEFKKRVREFIINELGIKIKSLTFIETGITNYNFFLNEKYIIKIKDDRLRLANDYNNEKQLALLLEKVNLTSKHAFYNDFIVVDYITNTAFLTLDNYENYLEKLIEVIKKVHLLPPKGFTNFDPFKRLELYRQGLGSSFTLENEEKTINDAKYYYDKAKKCVCHNDLVNGNILVKKGQLYLIDFEYSGLNDPDFDVVSFLSENDFVTSVVEEEFLKLFYKDEIPFAKLLAYTKFLNLLWYYWGLFAYQQTKKAIFYDIALNKKQKYLN